MKSLDTRVFFELTPAFPENSLAQGLQQQFNLLGTERVNFRSSDRRLFLFCPDMTCGCPVGKEQKTTSRRTRGQFLLASPL